MSPLPHLDLPTLALAVRQPWAWAIIHAGKDIENRSWQAVNHGLTKRGRIAILAAKGMTKGGYEDARDFINEVLAASPDFGLRCPAAIDLLRGGIIGSVEVVDVVIDSESGWFCGPRGLVLRRPIPCEFIPAKGALGYFTWTRAVSVEVSAPAKWMLPAIVKPVPERHETTVDGQGKLL